MVIFGICLMVPLSLFLIRTLVVYHNDIANPMIEKTPQLRIIQQDAKYAMDHASRRYIETVIAEFENRRRNVS